MIAVLGVGSYAAQLGSLVIVGTFTVIASFVLVKLVAMLTPIRISQQGEFEGLDLTSHGEQAYQLNS